MRLGTHLLGKTWSFRDVKDVMAKANEEKSGDLLAGIAATSAAERVAAKVVLSELTLSDLRENPAVPPEQDEISRLQEEDLDQEAFAKIKGLSVGEFREWLLRRGGKACSPDNGSGCKAVTAQISRYPSLSP